MILANSQGVLHRDIKGANILTTKDGVAKLADFGLAARAAALGDASLQDEVIGSPYWMAPEIIEMSAAPSAACDIWSLGCTIIELIAGKPPHFDLAPMAALFRIVQDDVPPLPGGISEALRDFLLQCFNRESVLRAGARSLLCHAWLERARSSPLPTSGTQPKSIIATDDDDPIQGVSTSSSIVAPGKSIDLPILSLKSLTSDSAFDDESGVNNAPAELRLSESDLDAFLADAKRQSRRFGSLATFLKGHSVEDDGEGDGDGALKSPVAKDLDDMEARSRQSPSVVYDEQNLLNKLTEQVDEGLLSPALLLPPGRDEEAPTPSTQLAPSPSDTQRPTQHLSRDNLDRFRENDDEAVDLGLDLENYAGNGDLDMSQKFAMKVARRSLSTVATKVSFSDDEDSDSGDEGDDLSDISSLERSSSLVNADPFSHYLFDDERDFIHDDARARETRRLEEIETLLERLPIGLEEDDEIANNKSHHGKKERISMRSAPASAQKSAPDREVASLQKTEAACAALRRLIELQGNSLSEPIVLSEHAIASMLEAVQRALDRRCIAAIVAVLRVVHSVCRRGDIQPVVALGLTPLLARVTIDLDDKAASSAIVQIAAIVDHICSSGTDETVRLFTCGGGLEVLSQLLLPGSCLDDGKETGVQEENLVVDVHRWSAAKVAVDALLCVLRREASSKSKSLLSVGSLDQKIPAGDLERPNRCSYKYQPRAVRLSRNAICLTLARLNAPPRLAAGLAAAMQLEDAARRAIAKANHDAARRRIAGASALAERSAAALCAFCEADTHVRERVARTQTVRVILAVLAAAPKRVALMTTELPSASLEPEADAHARLAVALVKALKALCMASANALNSLASAGAIEVVVGLLAAAQQGHSAEDDTENGHASAEDANDNIRKLDGIAVAQQPTDQHVMPDAANTALSGSMCLVPVFPRRDELEGQLVPCLYYLCRINRVRLARAAACGAARRLAACVARRQHLKQFALAILCELCHAASADCGGEVSAASSPPNIATFSKTGTNSGSKGVALAATGRTSSCNDARRTSTQSLEDRQTSSLQGAASEGDNTIAAELWRAGGVRLYARLLAEAYWGVRALAALAAWLAHDTTHRVEEELATRACAERVVALFRGAQRTEFAHALPPLQDALWRSPLFASALLCVGAADECGADSPSHGRSSTKRKRRRHAFAREVARRLRRHTSAIVRKSLLEILRITLKAATHPRRLLAEADLDTTLEKLACDTEQVLVRDLALSILAARYSDDVRSNESPSSSPSTPARLSPPT